MEWGRKYRASGVCFALMIALVSALVSFAPMVDVPETAYNELDTPVLTAIPLNAQAPIPTPSVQEVVVTVPVVAPVLIKRAINLDSTRVRQSLPNLLCDLRC